MQHQLARLSAESLTLVDKLEREARVHHLSLPIPPPVFLVIFVSRFLPCVQPLCGLQEEKNAALEAELRALKQELERAKEESQPCEHSFTAPTLCLGFPFARLLF